MTDHEFEELRARAIAFKNRERIRLAQELYDEQEAEHRREELRQRGLNILLLLCFGALTALFLAGCGGGGGDSSAPAPEQSTVPACELTVQGCHVQIPRPPIWPEASVPAAQ